MKFKIKSFQEGGQMAPESAPAAPQGGAPEQGGAPAEGGGQDPLMQIAEMFSQALQSQDCAALSQGAQMFLQLISQAQGGGGAQGGGQAEQPGQPVFKKGGKFGEKIQMKSRKPVEEAKKGAKMKAKC